MVDKSNDHRVDSWGPVDGHEGVRPVHEVLTRVVRVTVTTLTTNGFQYSRHLQRTLPTSRRPVNGLIKHHPHRMDRWISKVSSKRILHFNELLTILKSTLYKT